MKAAIIFTGTGPILILTSYDSLSNEHFVKKLETKGIRKFIGYEVPAEMVEERYGHSYNAVMGDLKQEDDLRVLDYDGHRIFKRFSLKELGDPVFYET